MKTITYNPETHVLVPKGMMYELPELPMPIKGKFSKDLFDGVQMHQYAMRYLDEAIAAAPQPEQVDVDPVGYVGYGDRVEWYKKPAPETDLYTTPQPDRTAELEAETTKLKLDLLTSYGEAEELSGKVAELEAALKVARDTIKYYSIVCGEDDQPTPAKETLAKINEVLK